MADGSKHCNPAEWWLILFLVACCSSRVAHGLYNLSLPVSHLWHVSRLLDHCRLFWSGWELVVRELCWRCWMVYRAWTFCDRWSHQPYFYRLAGWVKRHHNWPVFLKDAPLKHALASINCWTLLPNHYVSTKSFSCQHQLICFVLYSSALFSHWQLSWIESTDWSAV